MHGVALGGARARPEVVERRDAEEVLGVRRQLVHLHAALSRTDGSVIGGHIKGKAVIATTAVTVDGKNMSLCYLL